VSKTPKANADPVTLDAATTFEAAQEELEGLIARIESGEAGLEESMAAYERGLALLKHCRGILEQAEQKFTDLTGKFKEEA
jgi:exodeoxyribonuclease VII small subunit